LKKRIFDNIMPLKALISESVKRDKEVEGILLFWWSNYRRRRSRQFQTVRIRFR
jgi:hypothetical protein